MHFPPKNEGTTPNFSLKFNLEIEKMSLKSEKRMKLGGNPGSMLTTAEWSGVGCRLAEQNPKAFLWRSRTNEWRAFKPRSIYFGQKNNFWTFQLLNLIRQIKSGQKSVKTGFPVVFPKKIAKMKGQNELHFSWREKCAKMWKPKNFLDFF